MKPLILTLSALGIMLLLDGAWLGLVAKQFYNTHIGHLMSAQVNWGAAIVFYLLFGLSLVFLILLPHQNASLGTIALYAALFGIVCYGTYDLTNMATLKNWPLIVTVVDMTWGAVITTITAVGATHISRFFG